MWNRCYLALLILLIFLTVLSSWTIPLITLFLFLISVLWAEQTLVIPYYLGGKIQTPWFILWGEASCGLTVQTQTSFRACIGTENGDQLSCSTCCWVYGFHKFVAFLYLKLPHYLYSHALLLPSLSAPSLCPLPFPSAQIPWAVKDLCPEVKVAFPFSLQIGNNVILP